MQIKTNPEVEILFDKYPPHVRKKITHLRNLIIQTANETKGITALEETLRWGEPSFLAKNGSTIRINSKKNAPDQYGIYFQCTSKLVPTFKIIYRDTFTFEGNRAIIFRIKDTIPEVELKSCITAALTYHTVKHLPTLGM